MYVNAKMIPSRNGEGKKKTMEAVNSSTMYLIHCKNLYKNTPKLKLPHSAQQ
jgi:hypothetical protein